MTEDVRHEADREIHRELVRLRYGRALQAMGLRSRLGPRLGALSRVQPPDDDHAIRQKVSALLTKAANGFPPDLQAAVNVAFAIDSRVWFATLEKREGWLADQLDASSSRTARRRVDEACARLAQVLRRWSNPPDPEQGWQLSRLNALLCLDRPTPELYEERTIVATRDGLDEIQTRVSLPRLPAGARPDGGEHELAAKVLYGVSLRSQEPLHGAHYRHTLALPRTLGDGERVTYQIVYAIPRQRMLPHYALVPLAPCDSFHVRVRFDPRCLPEAVWQLEKVAHRSLDEEDPGAPGLAVDAAGEVSVAFADLRQGLGYGVAWRPGG